MEEPAAGCGAVDDEVDSELPSVWDSDTAATPVSVAPISDSPANFAVDCSPGLAGISDVSQDTGSGCACEVTGNSVAEVASSVPCLVSNDLSPESGVGSMINFSPRLYQGHGHKRVLCRGRCQSHIGVFKIGIQFMTVDESKWTRRIIAFEMIRAVAASRVLRIRSGIRLASRQDEVNIAASGYIPVGYTKRAMKSTPDRLAIRRFLDWRVVIFGIIPRASVE
ncbi:MAG: hypothetical protein ACE5EC_05055 [Phycisphaerae bacterium]